MKKNLKWNDFNLSPPKKPSVFFHWIIPMFLFWGTLGAVIVAGVIYPQIEMVSLRYAKGNLDKQLETLSKFNAEYNGLSAAAAAARELIDGISTFKNEVTSVYEIYTALVDARPNGVTLGSLSMSNGSVQINGTSLSEELIHEFALNLESDERLTSWFISSVADTGGFDERWTFSMEASYKVPPVTEEVTAQ